MIQNPQLASLENPENQNAQVSKRDIIVIAPAHVDAREMLRVLAASELPVNLIAAPVSETAKAPEQGLKIILSGLQLGFTIPIVRPFDDYSPWVNEFKGGRRNGKRKRDPDRWR